MSAVTPPDWKWVAGRNGSCPVVPDLMPEPHASAPTPDVPAAPPDGPRVLILVENLSVPFDRRVWQEALTLRDAGYRVTVVSPRGTTRDRELAALIDGIQVYRYPLTAETSGGIGGYAREYLTAVAHSLRLAWRHGPFDAVQVCNPPDLLFAAALPLRLRGAKLIYDQHDLVPELYLSRFRRGKDVAYKALRLFERATYALSSAVISTNESYRRIALERGRVRPDRSFVVRSAPDLSRFAPVPVDESLRRGASHLLCYVGVMGPQDGVDYAVRSLAALRDDFGYDDWHAVFVGDGDSYEDTVALVEQLDLADKVTFTGFDPDIARYICSADVCLAPDPMSPLNDLSTMNKIVEYMALGRPVVSFDLTESRVSAGTAAVYAPADDIHRFAQAILGLLRDPARREAMGRVGRARVEGELSWEHSQRNLLAAYRAALGSKAPPPRPLAPSKVAAPPAAPARRLDVI